MPVKIWLNVHRKHLLFVVFLFFMILLVVSLISCVAPFFDSFSKPKTSLKDATHVKSEEELRAAITNASPNKPFTIALDNDITLTNGRIAIGANQDITLTSNKDAGYYKLIGATQRRQPTIFVQDWSVLRLDGIIITHAKDSLGNGLSIDNDGTLIMYDGEISGNNNPLKSMEHGVFEGASGGVSNSGTFVMFGGKITNNTAYRGGGVSNTNSGKFTMYGGTISNNAVYGMDLWGSNAIGGGVYNISNFTMYGGAISDNHTNDRDNNVYGTVKRFGGTISDKTHNNSLSYVTIYVVVAGIIICVIGFLFIKSLSEYLSR